MAEHDPFEAAAHCPNCGAEYRAGFETCADCGSALSPGPAPPESDPTGTIEIVSEMVGDLGLPEQHSSSDDPDADRPDEREAGTGESDSGAQQAPTEEPSDLFASEEHPERMILAELSEHDAVVLVDLLGRRGIGARRGIRDSDGSVDVLIHDFRLPEAQAVLAEFTGEDLRNIVSAMGGDDEVDEASTGEVDAWAAANREVWGEDARSSGDDEDRTAGVVRTAGLESSSESLAGDPRFITLTSLPAADAYRSAARLAGKGIHARVVVPPSEESSDLGAFQTAALMVHEADADRARNLLGLVL